MYGVRLSRTSLQQFDARWCYFGAKSRETRFWYLQHSFLYVHRHSGDSVIGLHETEHCILFYINVDSG